MTMNKSEKATFEDAVNALASARALRWPEYDKPEPLNKAQIDVLLMGPHVTTIPSERWGGTRKIVKGWDYNTHTGDVFEIGTNGISHCQFYNGNASSWAQRMGRVFTTKVDALRALRYELTVKHSRQLANIDAEIRRAVSE